ncbi:MAG: hypothetical protein FWD91_07770 [Treponema sp.]|nr:hypothetical protein [Treponema sp.]
MDERKAIIRELEGKKRADTEARSRLLEGLGEVLVRKLEEGNFYSQAIGGILTEYHEQQNEIATAAEAIKTLEADALRLKELDNAIAAKEGESGRLTKEFAEACAHLGKFLRQTHIFDHLYREQEELLLSKIDEQEQKARDLQDREGGVIAWLGKNAQIAVTKALLLKNRSALQKLYRSAGEQFFAADASADDPALALDEEAAAAARSASALKGDLDSLGAELAVLKAERRKLADIFGAEGSPSRRIQANQRRIAAIREGFPGLYQRLGSLAENSPGKEALEPVFSDEDKAVLEKAAFHQSAITQNELKLKKVKAEIDIDSEKAEIEKIKKAITHQRKKIAAATEEIGELEKQIGDCEQSIEALKKFLKENE